MGSHQNLITRYRRWARLAALVLLCSCAFVFCPCVSGQQARGPFSANEIAGLLKSGVTAARVESLASQYGIAFQVTPEIQTELREAGASQELLDKLRQLAPRPVSKPAPPPEAVAVINAPAGAEVYVDSKLAGTANAQGQLTVPHLAAGKHTVHVVAKGYQAYNGSFTTKPGVPGAFGFAYQKIQSSPISTFPVKLQRSLIGTSSGVLKVGKGRIQFIGDKGRDSFDFPVSSIEQYGTVRVGADFYVTIRNGKKGHKNYYFYGAAPAALQAIAQAVKPQ